MKETQSVQILPTCIYFASTELYSGPLLECKICDKGHIKREKKFQVKHVEFRTDTVCSCCWTD